jgi:hypothetical protein
MLPWQHDSHPLLRRRGGASYHRRATLSEMPKVSDHLSCSEKGSHVRESIPVAGGPATVYWLVGLAVLSLRGEDGEFLVTWRAMQKAIDRDCWSRMRPARGWSKKAARKPGQTTGGRNLERDVRGLDRFAVAKSRRETAKPFRPAPATVRARHASRRAGQHLIFGP